MGVGMLRDAGDSLDFWFLGFLVSKDSWFLGFEVSWFLNFKMSESRGFNDPVLSNFHFMIFYRS